MEAFSLRKRIWRRDAHLQRLSVGHAAAFEIFELLSTGRREGKRASRSIDLGVCLSALPPAVGPVVHGVPAFSAGAALRGHRIRTTFPGAMPIFNGQLVRGWRLPLKCNDHAPDL